MLDGDDHARTAGAPANIDESLRPGEELLVWGGAHWAPHDGTIAVTTDRVIFATRGGQWDEHRLDPHATIKHAPGQVKITFENAYWGISRIDADKAKEIAATLAPGFVDRLFDGDAAMQQELRRRHEATTERRPALEPKISITLWGCTYLGGFYGLSAPRIRTALTFSPDAITISEQALLKKATAKTLYTVAKPRRSGVAIEGTAQMQQRLAATRIAALGVFALAAPKRTRTATSYVALTVAVGSGETGIVEVNDADPMTLQARLSPWLAEH
jgi:hypothetical protein